MITTLAWDVLGIVSAPWRASGAYRPSGRTDRLFCQHNLWFPGSYARYATPRTHSLSLRGAPWHADRAIMFRETMFRGMDVPSLFQPRRRSCPPVSMPSTARYSKNCRTCLLYTSPSPRDGL